MTAEDLKRVFRAQGYVRWDGIQPGGKYFLQGINAQWINGRVVTSAILLDNNTNGRTIYQVKPEDVKEI